MYVYYNSLSKRTYIVSNNYNHNLSQIDKMIEFGKKNGLTIPENKEKITIEVLASQKHTRHISIEFYSQTKPTCEFTDLDKNPEFYGHLTY